MKTRIVVLGAGFGGLELTTILSEAFGEAIDVTLIDKSDTFVFGFSKLDVMFGRQTLDEVRLPYREIAIPGVEFHQESIVSIDPHTKRVVTSASTSCCPHAADPATCSCRMGERCRNSAKPYRTPLTKALPTRAVSGPDS